LFQPDPLLHWAQRVNNKTNVLVQVNAEFLNSLPNVVSVY
jgi:hypothetical protein